MDLKIKELVEQFLTTKNDAHIQELISNTRDMHPLEVVEQLEAYGGTEEIVEPFLTTTYEDICQILADKFKEGKVSDLTNEAMELAVAIIERKGLLKYSSHYQKLVDYINGNKPITIDIPSEGDDSVSLYKAWTTLMQITPVLGFYTNKQTEDFVNSFEYTSDDALELALATSGAGLNSTDIEELYLAQILNMYLSFGEVEGREAEIELVKNYFGSDIN